MIAYRQELICDARPDIEAVLPTQWAETGDTALVAAPNWPLYQALERSGVLLVARENDRFVGYAGAILHAHMNSVDVLVGTVATWWVEDRPARAGIARGMFRHMIEILHARGARRIFIETEYDHSAGRLLEAMKFRPKKIGYSLELMEGGNA